MLGDHTIIEMFAEFFYDPEMPVNTTKSKGKTVVEKYGVVVWLHGWLDFLGKWQYMTMSRYLNELFVMNPAMLAAVKEISVPKRNGTPISVDDLWKYPPFDWNFWHHDQEGKVRPCEERPALVVGRSQPGLFTVGEFLPDNNIFNISVQVDYPKDGLQAHYRKYNPRTMKMTYCPPVDVNGQFYRTPESKKRARDQDEAESAAAKLPA